MCGWVRRLGRRGQGIADALGQVANPAVVVGVNLPHAIALAKIQIRAVQIVDVVAGDVIQHLDAHLMLALLVVMQFDATRLVLHHLPVQTQRGAHDLAARLCQGDGVAAFGHEDHSGRIEQLRLPCQGCA